MWRDTARSVDGSTPATPRKSGRRACSKPRGSRVCTVGSTRRPAPMFSATPPRRARPHPSIRESPQCRQLYAHCAADRGRRADRDPTRAGGVLGWTPTVDGLQPTRPIIDADPGALRHDGSRWIDTVDLRTRKPKSAAAEQVRPTPAWPRTSSRNGSCETTASMWPDTATARATTSPRPARTSHRRDRLHGHLAPQQRRGAPTVDGVPVERGRCGPSRGCTARRRLLDRLGPRPGR